MKKKILLPLAALMVMGMASCGNEGGPTSSSGSASSEASSQQSSDPSSEPTSVTPVFEKTTLEELIEWNAEQSGVVIDGDTVWEIDAILEGCAHDAYGNGWLVAKGADGVYRQGLIYGSTTTKECISKDPDTGLWTFANPKDGDKTLTEYESGMKVNMKFIRESYNGKLEILGYFDGHEAGTAEDYPVTVVEDTEHGTVAVDKTAVAYGEDVAFSVTPVAGWKVKSVKILNNLVNSTLTKATLNTEDGKYHFSATTANQIQVEYEEEGTVKTFYEVKHDSEGVPSGYSESKTAKADVTKVGTAAEIDGMKLNFVNMATYTGNDYMQVCAWAYNKAETAKEWRHPGFVYNTEALGKAITKIVVKANNSKTATNAPSPLQITSGTAAIDGIETTGAGNVIEWKGTAADGYTVEYTPANTGDTFFAIGHGCTTTYAININSIEVWFA